MILAPAPGTPGAHRRGGCRHGGRAVRDWQAWLRSFGDPRLYTALWLLTDSWQSYLLWTGSRIGIGRVMDTSMPGDPGEWPQLLAGVDPGHAPDTGIRPSPAGAVVRLLMPQGFSVTQIRERLDNLAAALDVPEVRVLGGDGAVVRIELRVRNPLAAAQRLPEPEPSPVPLKGVRIGVVDNGAFHRLAIWSNHVFVAGLTGSGKSGLLWSIIAALAPDIAVGRVELNMIDLKFGTEMASGYRLFASFAWQALDAIDILERLAMDMQRRADPRREHSMRTGEPLRAFDPRPGDPQKVLMIDEVLDLLKISGDYRLDDRELLQFDGSWKKEKNMTVARYAGRLLLSLLSRARSFGITIIVATQNAAKEIFELLRDMFPTMLGLRLASEQQLQMVFSTGARDRGIRVDIGPDEQGTVYVDAPEKGGQAVRARCFHVTNDDIIRLVDLYGRPADVAAPTPTSAQSPTSHAGDAGSDRDNVVAMVSRERGGGEAAAGCHEEKGVCGYCGAELEQAKGGRRRKYCDDAHRIAAFRERRTQGG